MEKIVLGSQDYKQLELLNCPPHAESRLFTDGKSVYKILLKNLRRVRKDIIVSLHDYPIEGSIRPDKLLYNERGQFIGYTMPLLKQYFHLLNFEQSLSIPERMNLIQQIETIYERFLKHGYLYYDNGPYNIMRTQAKIMFVDVDSIVPIGDVTEIESLTSIKDLTCTCLSLLLQMNLYGILWEREDEEMISRFARVEDLKLLEIILFIMKDEIEIPNFKIAESFKEIDVEKVIQLKNRIFR